MANIFGGTTWTLDTLGVVCTYPVYVKSIKVIGELAAGGENFIILDPVTAKPLWETVATPGSFQSSTLLEQWWINGLNLSSLGGLAGAKIMVDLG